MAVASAPMLTKPPALGGGGGGSLPMVATCEERLRPRSHTVRAVFISQTFCPHVGGFQVHKVTERALWLMLLNCVDEWGLCGCEMCPEWVWAWAVPERGFWRAVIPPGWESRTITNPYFSLYYWVQNSCKSCVFLQMLSACNTIKCKFCVNITPVLLYGCLHTNLVRTVRLRLQM